MIDFFFFLLTISMYNFRNKDFPSFFLFFYFDFVLIK